MYSFIWNGPNKDKIKRNLLVQPYDVGGLKMTHILSQNYVLKLSWLKRLTHPDFNGKWKELVFVQLPSLQGDIWRCNIDHKDIAFVFKKTYSSFWKEIIRIWFDFTFYQPKKIIEIKAQVLWYNSLIKIQDKPVLFRTWYENGIKTVSDLIDDNGHLLTFERFSVKFPNIKTNFLQFQSLIHALPKKWKQSIVNDIGHTDSHGLHVYKYWIDKINGKSKVPKMLYPLFIEKNIKVEVSVLRKWGEDLDQDIDYNYWKSCFEQIYQSSISSNIRIFQYKFLHRIIFTNYRLHKMGVIDNPVCIFCRAKNETLLHFFLMIVLYPKNFGMIFLSGCQTF